MSRSAELGKCVGMNISFITYDEITPVYTESDKKGKEKRQITYSSSGSIVRRNRKLKNAILSFCFYTKDYPGNYMDAVNTVNKNSVTVGGTTIPMNKGLLLKYLPTPITLHKCDRTGKVLCDSQYFKIEVEIEVEMQKSILYTEYLDEDVYVNSPITKERVRLQFSNDYRSFINDKQNYPNAFHIRDGFGFYSEDRPDLNILDNVPLDGSGNLLAKDAEPVFHRAYDALIEDWGFLHLPLVCNVVNNLVKAPTY